MEVLLCHLCIQIECEIHNILTVAKLYPHVKFLFFYWLTGSFFLGKIHSDPCTGRNSFSTK
ncbi:MAG: hypothetical protein A3B90_01145 [Candidatus Magasanikbacteria bacterium RIFCSPHIGHO2_02_FULL_41_13]|uniref:Uncharacterized protein n=1 Tax=Candidatus Magasanikbacteria bacterium RIFCSPHIGHO2_02_FULL_41_13 TaxID=1798676 RepID=A0A1F6M4X5_9BACT|nr:MAG: hypothetical protein A3B90_01145 [Candidatus Magasanikbacteria bacterium RIFCSPHIGHO2_02_FULL_41_13]